MEIDCQDVQWKRFAASKDCPSGLILDGPNPYMVGREDAYAPHGYATLEFQGRTLTERIHLADGRVVWQSEIIGTQASSSGAAYCGRLT